MITFLRSFFRKAPIDERQRLIREEMSFVLEPHERWFDKQLQAHLLDEGCNLPMIVAKPRFYRLLLSGLFTGSSSGIHMQLKSLLPNIFENDGAITHADFHKAIRFFAGKGKLPGKQIAVEVTKAIQVLQQEWLLDPEIFYGDVSLSLFTEKVNSSLSQLELENVPFDRACRRLYISLTTSLLSKMNVRQAFEKEFGALPSLLKTMHREHAEFCRFMKFCQERTPYFNDIVSRTFWRTLESMRTESGEHRRHKR